MDRRKTAFAVVLAVLITILAGCSTVFEAGISGKVVTASGTGTANVPDVSVFAYTDEGRRNSDYDKFVAGTITRPDEGSGYVAATTTNANGEFTVNKIVWKTTNPEFGKTADVSKLFLIFYHEDYKPAKADATVISGSTNSSNVYVKLEGSKDYTTLNITVYDVTTKKAMTTPVTLEYWLDDSTAHDTVTLIGNASIPISFKKGENPDVFFALSSPGDSWKMCTREGSLIPEYKVLDVEEGTLRVSLYMMGFEYTLPAFSGDIDGTYTTTPNLEGVDNVRIHLAYVDKNGGVQYFSEVESSAPETYSSRVPVGDNVWFQHGLFSGIGYNDNYSIVISKENYPEIIDWAAFEGTELSIKLRIVFDFPAPATSKYYEFFYSPLRESNLGHIKDKLESL